jgi:hypothetical protein
VRRATREIISAERAKVFWEFGPLRTLPMVRAQTRIGREKGPLRDDLGEIEEKN